MAILKELPERAIIAGMKKTIDFYVWMGIPVARSWPRSPGVNRSSAVMSQWPAFAYASREWVNLSNDTRRTFEELSSGTGLSGRDMFMRAYLRGLYRYPLEPHPAFTLLMAEPWSMAGPPKPTYTLLVTEPWSS